MTVCLTKSTRVYTDGGITGPWPESIGRMVRTLRTGDWRVTTGPGWVVADSPIGERVEVEALPTAEEESTTLGVSRGWEHANYADAYGQGPDDDDETAAHRAASEHRTPGTPLHAAYVRSFLLGCQRYREGRWQDGSAQD